VTMGGLRCLKDHSRSSWRAARRTFTGSSWCR